MTFSNLSKRNRAFGHSIRKKPVSLHGSSLIIRSSLNYFPLIVNQDDQLAIPKRKLRKGAGSDLFVPPYSSSLLAPSSLPSFSLFLVVQRRACDTVTRWQADASVAPRETRRKWRKWEKGRKKLADRKKQREEGDGGGEHREVIGNIAGNNGVLVTSYPVNNVYDLTIRWKQRE